MDATKIKDVMPVKNIVQALGVKPEQQESLCALLEKGWSESQSNRPAGVVPFLEKDFLIEVNRHIGLSEQDLESLCLAADSIKQDDILCRLIWHYHYVCFVLTGYLQADVAQWPSLATYSQLFHDMAFGLLTFSAIPKMVAIYESRHIPLAVLHDTLKGIRQSANDSHQKHGRLIFSNFAWLCTHQLIGNTFQIGLLVYEIRTLPARIKVFRHKDTGDILTLSEPGITYRKDGQVDGTNEIFDETGAWVSEYTHVDGLITGNPIHDDGYAIQKKITIVETEWHLLMAYGDPALAFHIPAGGRLVPALVDESLAMAIAFFKKHFPEKTFQAIHIWSWLVDTQLQALLPADSNIVRFQKRFRLYPSRTNDASVFHFIFGVPKPEDLSVLPREKTLHRVILDYYDKGGMMQVRTGYILLA